MADRDPDVIKQEIDAARDQLLRILRMTITTVTRHTPASVAATAGFFTKFRRPALMSSAILCGFARTASESTVAAN